MVSVELIQFGFYMKWVKVLAQAELENCENYLKIPPYRLQNIGKESMWLQMNTVYNQLQPRERLDLIPMFYREMFIIQ